MQLSICCKVVLFITLETGVHVRRRVSQIVKYLISLKSSSLFLSLDQCIIMMNKEGFIKSVNSVPPGGG